MSDHIVIVDGYNVILRSPELRPEGRRTLRDSRAKLLNLLAWSYGVGDVRFIVVFDGAAGGGGKDDSTPRVEVRYSEPPQKADDLIRELVEHLAGGYVRVTVVTADLEVARHARAMGADIAIADLFLASALGSQGKPADSEKPSTLSRKELEEWAEIFKRRQGSGNEES